MHLYLPCLCVMEDLTDVVHWALDAPGHLRGGASSTMGSGPRLLGLQDPTLPLRAGTQRLLGRKDPK
jgi:hypothetical protein